MRRHRTNRLRSRSLPALAPAALVLLAFAPAVLIAQETGGADVPRDPNGQPDTARLLMKKSGVPMFEYACHEGNYGLYNMLSGARAKEAEAAAATGGGSE